MPDIVGLNGGLVKATPDLTDLLPIQDTQGITHPTTLAGVVALTLASANFTTRVNQLIGSGGGGGTTGATGATGTGGGGLSPWATKTANYTAIAGDRLRINASAGDVVISLPVSPTATDADILFQRLDLGANKVLLRSGTNKFNSQANQDAVFAPATINLIEGISYVNSAIGWLNQHNRLTFQAYAAPSTIDLFYSNVTFLLRATSSGFSDLKGRAITSAGATLSTTARYGGYSVQVASGNISIPNPETLISPTGDWTIDFTYRNISRTDYGAIFSLDGTDYPLTIYYGFLIGGNLIGGVGDNTSWYAPNVDMGAGDITQFNYYGMKREGGNISGWKNGVQVSTFAVPSTSAIGIPSGFALLGQNGASNFTSGFYDDFRITNGVARDLSVIPTGKFPSS